MSLGVWDTCIGWKFVTGYMEDSCFPRKQVLFIWYPRHPRASQTHTWPAGSFSQYYPQRESSTAKHVVGCTMKIIFLFLYCNPSSASGVSTGNICMNMCHPPEHCKIFALALLLQHLVTGSFFYSSPAGWWPSGKEKREQRAEQSCVLLV